MGLVLLSLLAIPTAMASAAGLDVQVWTDRGDDAVYQPGDPLQVSVRPSQDAYLMVYEIDSEGYVKLLYPYRNSTGFAEAHQTYQVPPEHSNIELVVDQAPAGQCYIVAIASRDRFKEYPWYLRPYDMQAEQVGYQGAHDEEEGVTSEGRIVGDPFVAMEKIRRRVVEKADDPDAFATSYTTYYVHEQVRYPRYLCYDCHRPGRWAWWADFDPYYTHCSVFEFRINWGWYWGPGYWFGTVPYYCYVPRYNCPPGYRTYHDSHTWFSSWDGWRRWNTMWGDHLVRFKSAPPPNYVPPSRYPDRGGWRTPGSAPPGFITANVQKGREGLRQRMVIGRGYQDTRPENAPPVEGTRGGRMLSGSSGRRGAEPLPAELGRGRELRWTSPRERKSEPAIQPREEKPREGGQSQGKASAHDRRSDPAPAERPRDSGGGGFDRSPAGGGGRMIAPRGKG